MALVWAIVALLGSLIFTGVMNIVSNKMRSDLEILWRISEGRKKVCALNILGLGVHRIQEGGIELGGITEESSEVWNGFVGYIIGTSNLGISEDPAEATDLSSVVGNVEEFCSGTCKQGDREWQLYMFKTGAGNYYLVSRVRCTTDRRWIVAWARGREEEGNGGGGGDDEWVYEWMSDDWWEQFEYDEYGDFHGGNLLVGDARKYRGDVSAKRILVYGRGVLWIEGKTEVGGNLHLSNMSHMRTDSEMRVKKNLTLTNESVLWARDKVEIGGNLQLTNETRMRADSDVEVGKSLSLTNESVLWIKGKARIGEKLDLTNRTRMRVDSDVNIGKDLSLTNRSGLWIGGNTEVRGKLDLTNTTHLSVGNGLKVKKDLSLTNESSLCVKGETKIEGNVKLTNKALMVVNSDMDLKKDLSLTNVSALWVKGKLTVKKNIKLTNDSCVRADSGLEIKEQPFLKMYTGSKLLVKGRFETEETLSRLELFGTSEVCVEGDLLVNSNAVRLYGGRLRYTGTCNGNVCRYAEKIQSCDFSDCDFNDDCKFYGGNEEGEIEWEQVG